MALVLFLVRYGYKKVKKVIRRLVGGSSMEEVYAG